MTHLFRAFTVALLINIFISNALACSSFQLKAQGASYVGKSYDWHFGDGLIIYNPSALEKFSLTLSEDQKKTSWTSQYSSITYNQYGLDFPNGGMNEEGLTVEVLWLDGSVYPAKDDKAVLNELQWIQYVLDTEKTLAGAINTLETIRIDPVYAKVHYFICDIQENCATVEFVKGKTIIGKYDQVGLEVITNDTHKDSTKYLTKFKNFGGTKDIVWGNYNSLDRYARINELLRTYNETDPLNYAFKILDSVRREKVSIGSYMQWQIVYDKQNLKSYFKTSFGNKDAASVSLNSFPTHCSNRYYFDMGAPARGNLELEFKPLPLEVNYAHVKKTLKKVMPSAPEEMVKAISGAPFKFKCIQ